jgi:peptidoglycan/xylan/chitin deacetylase (PgdA/CDA1 family)
VTGFRTLMYHEIIKREDYNPDNYLGIDVKQDYKDILPQVLFAFKEEFEKQMEYLYDNGYTTLKLQQVIEYYYNDKPLPEKSVLLTFDDMYKSQLLYVYPVLKKYGFNAVGFVTLDWLFDEPKEYSTVRSVCLSKEELNLMSDVFEYANHTKALHTRKDNLTAIQTADKDVFMKDLKACDDFVDVKNIFAYPFGAFIEENLEWLREAGTLLAFTSEGGKNTKEKDPLRLYRNAVILHFGLDSFKEIINN